MLTRVSKGTANEFISGNRMGEERSFSFYDRVGKNNYYTFKA
jgi:hypothetical protein